MSKIWRGKRKLHAEDLEVLCRWYGVDVSGEPLAPPAPPPRTIPLYGLVSAGAFVSRHGTAVPQAAVTCFDPDLPLNTFALIVDGDSMNKLVLPDARIYVDPDDRLLRDGKFYVVRNSAGETTFKQFLTGPDRLVPRSTNRAHKPIRLGKEPIEVIGRVLCWVAWA